MPEIFKLMIVYWCYRTSGIREPLSPSPGAKWGVGSMGSPCRLDWGEIFLMSWGENAWQFIRIPSFYQVTFSCCLMLHLTLKGKFDVQFLGGSEPPPEPASAPRGSRHSHWVVDPGQAIQSLQFCSYLIILSLFEVRKNSPTKWKI